VRFPTDSKTSAAPPISAARLWLLAKALDAPVGGFFDGIDDDWTRPKMMRIYGADG